MPHTDDTDNADVTTELGAAAIGEGSLPDEAIALEVMSELDAEFAELEQEIARIGALPKTAAPEKVAMLEALRAKWRMRNAARKPDPDRPGWRKNIDLALEAAIGEILDDQAVDIDGNLAFTLENDTVQKHAPKVMQALAAGLGQAMTSGATGGSGEPETGAERLMRQLLAGFGTAMGQALKPVANKAAGQKPGAGASKNEAEGASARDAVPAQSPSAANEPSSVTDKDDACGESPPEAAESPQTEAGADGSEEAAASSEPAAVEAAEEGLDLLAEALVLAPIDAPGALHCFEGFPPADGRQRMFGGTFLGQAVAAACATVDMSDRVPHGMHANFLRPGDPTLPVFYGVEPLLDGGAVSTRYVRATQADRLVFTATVSFHAPQAGLAHQVTMPPTEPPEGFSTYVERLAEALQRAPHRRIFGVMADQPQLFERRDVEPVDLVEPLPRQGLKRFWFRASQPLADDLGLHYAALAWASDIGLLTHSGEVHGLTWMDTRVTAASVDHALWFHRPFRADNWLLYVSESPSASAGRGFNTGRIFARDGSLVASVAQEGLIQIRVC